ncbi:hypothetical protein IMZ48_31370 [Candidatus Bathyarchaeota archaeon]|nr:hypothetical protein [Candidatus Bathyarchaeota archaeon]
MPDTRTNCASVAFQSSLRAKALGKTLFREGMTGALASGETGVGENPMFAWEGSTMPVELGGRKREGGFHGEKIAEHFSAAGLVFSCSSL